MNTLFTLFAVIAVWFLTFGAGVVASSAVLQGAAVVVDRFNTLLVVQQVKTFGFTEVFDAYVEDFFCCVVPNMVERINAGAVVVVALVNAGAAVVRSSYVTMLERINAGAAVVVALVNAGAAVVVESIAVDLPATSFYSLTVDVDATQYPAGEYLVRDAGVWSNVYLTSYARRLMGNSADVVALSPATVVDATGARRVWTVAIA